jgi:peptidoglycan/LPS O-acetylase OafA/YrhL
MKVEQVKLLGNNSILMLIVGVMLCLLLVPAFDVVFVVLACCLIIGLTFEQSRIAELLSSPVIYWLGRISFSLYLVHFPLLALRPPLNDLIEGVDIPHAWTVVTCLLLVLAILTSALSFYLFERPAQRWVRVTFDRVRFLAATYRERSRKVDILKS